MQCDVMVMSETCVTLPNMICLTEVFVKNEVDNIYTSDNVYENAEHSILATGTSVFTQEQHTYHVTVNRINETSLDTRRWIICIAEILNLHWNMNVSRKICA